MKTRTDKNIFSDRAHQVIPGGAHTSSRGDDQFPELAPQAFARGKGAREWDIENVEYVDWGMGINNVLIGHAEDAIDDAAIAAIRNGQAFSRPTPLEVEVAEAILELFPAMDMVKYGKNGSDANTAAVRLSRAYRRWAGLPSLPGQPPSGSDPAISVGRPENLRPRGLTAVLAQLHPGKRELR